MLVQYINGECERKGILLRDEVRGIGEEGFYILC